MQVSHLWVNCFRCRRSTLRFDTMDTVLTLERHLAELGPLLVGFSGGVDSAVLAVAAHRVYGDQEMLAVVGQSASLPATQASQVVALAREVGFPIRVVPTHELDDPRYVANPTERCLYCKVELWRRLNEVRDELGFAAIVDGTHVDDLGGHRPGYTAGVDAGVHSPFVALGWGKDTIRRIARTLGIPLWNAPSAPCLASRIRYGLPVTTRRLHQVDQAETFLRDHVGVAGDIRVRHLGSMARIETNPDQFERLDAAWPAITDAVVQLGFDGVERDPVGYRRGAMLPVLEVSR